MSGQNNTLVITRMNVSNLTDKQLDSFRNAMEKFMKIRDNRGYSHMAGLHGAPDWYCWHHEGNYRNIVLRARLFLPWHRAYLKCFEDYLRDHDASAAQCWWDWTSPLSHTQGIPKAYADPNVGTKPNPLFKFHMSIPPQSDPNLPDNASIDRDTIRDPDLPRRLPNTSDIERLYEIEDFGAFSDALEDNFHDRVHGWCGGDMSDVTTAGYDPVFWAHHCNVDRIWSIWQLRHGNSSMPPDLLNLSLPPFRYTVREVLSIHDLGYEYATTSSEVKL